MSVENKLLLSRESCLYFANAKLLSQRYRHRARRFQWYRYGPIVWWRSPIFFGADLLLTFLNTFSHAIQLQQLILKRWTPDRTVEVFKDDIDFNIIADYFFWIIAVFVFQRGGDLKASRLHQQPQWQWPITFTLASTTPCFLTYMVAICGISYLQRPAF